VTYLCFPEETEQALTEYFDNETDFVYYNYRYYSPELGRWLSRDPIGERGGYNLYAMVGNGEVNWYDWRGLFDPEAELAYRIQNVWDSIPSLYSKNKRYTGEFEFKDEVLIYTTPSSGLEASKLISTTHYQCKCKYETCSSILGVINWHSSGSDSVATYNYQFYQDILKLSKEIIQEKLIPKIIELLQIENPSLNHDTITLGSIDFKLSELYPYVEPLELDSNYTVDTIYDYLENNNKFEILYEQAQTSKILQFKKECKEKCKKLSSKK